MTETSSLHQSDQKSWDDKWKKNTTPWDQEKPHAALVRTLEEAGSGEVPSIPTTGKALVPGCGRGYDVHLFAQRGLDSLGVDISETAVQAADEWLNSQQPKLEKESVKAADFFNLPRPEEGYVLFYDYTFLCALPPTLRSDWAEAYARLAASSATLITLQFPLDGDREGGPPYSVSEKLYEELLGDKWVKVWGRDVMEEESRKSSDVGQSSKEHTRQKIAVWKRQKS